MIQSVLHGVGDSGNQASIRLIVDDQSGALDDIDEPFTCRQASRCELINQISRHDIQFFESSIIQWEMESNYYSF